MQSLDELQQEVVTVPVELRPVLGLALLERLEGFGALVVCISVSGQHIHILAELEFRKDREWMGFAKKHAWFALRDKGWVGKLWGKRSKAVPVKTRRHQLNVYRYIVAHKNEGAWVWTMFDREKK